VRVARDPPTLVPGTHRFAQKPNSTGKFRHARSLLAGIQAGRRGPHDPVHGFPPHAFAGAGFENCGNDDPEICAPARLHDPELPQHVERLGGWVLPEPVDLQPETGQHR
jgi:hypothetical protein